MPPEVKALQRPPPVVASTPLKAPLTAPTWRFVPSYAGVSNQNPPNPGVDQRGVPLKAFSAHNVPLPDDWSQDPMYTFPWANSGAEPPHPSRAKDHRSAPVISSKAKAQPFERLFGSTAETQPVPAATVTPPPGNRPFVWYGPPTEPLAALS